MAKPRAKTRAAPIHVDIVSDLVCPWCWLGAAYFHAAVKTFSGKVDISWRPYMLDSTVPSEGIPYREYMKNKFGEAGPDSRWTAMREHLETAGPDVGIEFNFSKIKLRPNTLNAHRLMRWAQGQNKANAMSEALFKTVFTDCLDIGSSAILAKLAGGIGLDSALVSDLLASDKDKAEVTNEAFHFRSLGVSGVPTFIYNGQFAVQGAQPIETHLKAFKEAAKHPIDP